VLTFAAFHPDSQDTMTPGKPSKLQILERLEGDVTVLVLTGELTLDDGDLAFGRYVDGLIRQGRVKIVLNLTGVTYIDSAGVGMMVAESKMVREKGGVIKLAQLTARSHHLLAMMKLKVVFEIFDDEAAALQSFTWGLRP
jgi:anti-sigma B factor antagonist